jgi:hypothetical protein
VILVAHSQGNLIGNKVYSLFTDKQKEKFRMLSVGTPADSVAGGGKFINVDWDYIINAIPNALDGTYDGIGHGFRGVYLNIAEERTVLESGSPDATRAIVQSVHNIYNNFKISTQCTEYDTIYLYIDGLSDKLQIVGKLAGIYANEVILEQDIETRSIDDACKNYFEIGYNHPYFWYFKKNTYQFIDTFSTQKEVLSHQSDILKYMTRNYECVDISFEEQLFQIIYEALAK